MVYEFSQLAQHDFEAHGSDAVWERPLAYVPDDHKNWRQIHVDLSLFSKKDRVETRIEFGKSDPRPAARPTPRDEKLDGDSRKLHLARDIYRAVKDDPDIAEDSRLAVENYVILWDERDSRTTSKVDAKLTGARAKLWQTRCEQYATSATATVGVAVVLEAVAASSLMTLEKDAHRNAFAAIYSIGLA
ncbi:hypothetical protein [Clavibacter michiganensis]|uniref:hypothetical protein n=1 Tax=Clavibacter michiganensis TaxID=28447 RepID=UPI001BE0E5BF|nr:hypothetical protein [Clavibacter michiganensis]MBT1634569.1 hypothetical protein [Clavibacter michiganensis]